VARIDALFAIEREIKGLVPQQRLGVRTKRSRPLVIELEGWLREQRAKLSKNSETGKAVDYSFKRWGVRVRFLDDGRLCRTNNAAERELRAMAIRRRNSTFAGSNGNGRRAATLYTLIATAGLPDHPAGQMGQFLPWNWHAERRAAVIHGFRIPTTPQSIWASSFGC
jgi:transposase